MNLVIDQKQQTSKILLLVLAITTALYLLVTVSATNTVSYIKYNIPASSVDTGYHPGYKKVINW